MERLHFQKPTEVGQWKCCMGKVGELHLDFYLLSTSGTRKGEESPFSSYDSSPFSDAVLDNIFMPA